MIITNGQSRLEHKVAIRQRNVEHICAWCHEQFGYRFSIVDRETFNRDGVWHCTYQGMGRYRDDVLYEFSFDHEKDALLFTLRWV